ncbi:MAG TPA: VCBS repeat-containing protein, partial [Gemmatirosa sp.]
MLAPLACGRPDAASVSTVTPNATGQQLAAHYCQSCHILPTPDLLDSASWDQWVLPRMARRLGLRGVGDPSHLEHIEGGVARRLIRDAHVFSDSALMSRAEWDRLAAYYVHGAPAVLPRPATPPVTVGLPGFRVRMPDFHVANPMITLVHVDAPTGRIYLGDANPGRSTLAVLDGRGGASRSYPLPSPVAHLRVAGDTLGLVFMGQLNPSDVPRGSLAVISAWKPGADPTIAWEVDTLQRPVFASYADLNGDGREDAVVSEFGNMIGRLAWYERLPNGGSRRHVLAAEPGAMTTVVRDFDGDGRPDILELNAQADEGISLFHNRGNGAFVREWLLRFPPSYGSSSMEVADVNGDGFPDIIYTNGDNGDYPSPPKPYHGVHVF